MSQTLLLMTSLNSDHTQATLTVGSNRPLTTELTTKCGAVANRLRLTICLIDRYQERQQNVCGTIYKETQSGLCCINKVRSEGGLDSCETFLYAKPHLNRRNDKVEPFKCLVA